jgi:hypothetical protein
VRRKAKQSYSSKQVSTLMRAGSGSAFFGGRSKLRKAMPEARLRAVISIAGLGAAGHHD